jgi:hypothetical protein
MNGSFGEPRRSIVTGCEGPGRAGCVDYDCAYIRSIARPLASTVLPRVLERKKPPVREAFKLLYSLLKLVAGTGFEPVTFRL